LLKAMVGDALGDVQAEGDEGFGLDVDGPRKVDVVQVQAIGNGRQHQHLVRSAPADFQADRFAQEQIDIQWQVLAVLFGRSCGQDDQLLGRNGVVHLDPGQAVVTVLGSRTHDGPFLVCKTTSVGKAASILLTRKLERAGKGKNARIQETVPRVHSAWGWYLWPSVRFPGGKSDTEPEQRRKKSEDVAQRKIAASLFGRFSADRQHSADRIRSP